MVVTEIRRIDDKRYCLFVDYEPYASVYLSDIRRLRLKEGEDVDEDKLEEFRRDYLYKRAMNKAVNSIKFSDKCEYDIRHKLEELYYDEEIIETTINKLKTYGYIDNHRYAESYVRRHITRKGVRVIRRELLAKRIEAAIVEDVLENTDIPDEDEQITHILQKKYSVDDLRNKRERVYSYMYSKGFDYRTVADCVKRLVQESDE